MGLVEILFFRRSFIKTLFFQSRTRNRFLDWKNLLLFELVVLVTLELWWVLKLVEYLA